MNTENTLKDIAQNALISQACKNWLTAKGAENLARKARIDVEREIISMVGAKSEGAQTAEVGPYKITTTGKLTRKLDTTAYMSVINDVPVEVSPVEFNPSLDLKKLRALETANPGVYAIVSSCIEIKPAKTAVTVALIDKGDDHGLQI